MGQFGFGQSVRRVEDARLVTGRGRYTDDMTLGRQAFAFFIRSPHAHARITSVDVEAARSAPGVLAVLTGADVVADGLGTVPCLVPLKNKDGSRIVSPPRPLMPHETVKHVGDAVVMIVAETLAEARDAADLVMIDYDVLPAIASTAGALAEGAATVWPEARNNLCLDWEMGDRAAVDAAFGRAAHVTRVDLINNRIVVNSMEPRVAIGDYDGNDDKYVLYTSSQGVHNLQSQLAGHIFKVPNNRVRVVTRDVGGGFGMKIFLYPEQALVPWAAKKIGRPVKWVGDRSEAFTTDTQGRDHVTTAEMALDADGKFLAMRVSTIANLGAYLSNFGPFIPTLAGAKLYAAVYTFPAVLFEVKGVFTNTTPVDAYRGAGRPEAAYCVERLVDAAARDTGLSPAEIRRRNFIPPEAMPYTTILGAEYDSGEFLRNMEDALSTADWDGFEARRTEAAQRGKLRGIGLSSYIEACGGGNDESATITFDESGAVTVHVGSQSNGQGHETAYAQLVAETLGLPIEKVTVFQGDSDRYGFGRGTGGSRALPVGGSAVLKAANKVIEIGKTIAARQLEAAEEDIEFADGKFTIAGTDRSVEITQIAKSTFNPAKVDIDEIRPGIDETARFMPPEATYPNGCHVVELELDPDTGAVTIERFTVVDDFGRVMNPMMLAGQVHGGVAQGVGQALLEHTVYDEDSGQLVTGSFMDYTMPRADDLPNIGFAYNEVPCSRNPLGVKGAGEAGAIGAPPAVINALVDALSPLGVTHIDMPATPEKIWRTIQEIEGGLKTARQQGQAMLDDICRIARAAGAVIMPYFEGAALETQTKADRSQVTAADHAAEAVIIAGLLRIAPEIPIVAEEMMAAGNRPDIGGGRFWLVDPLDGTKEFIKKLPEFTVNIALIENGRPVMGVVYVPAAGTLYAGAAVGTAFKEIDGEEREPIAVHAIDRNAITVALSRTYGAGTQLTYFLEDYRVAKQVHMGSSIKFCLVACGEADVYPRYGGSSEWDTAAGHAVVNAAGGSVCVVDSDRELSYGKTNFSNPNFVVWGGRH